MLSVSIPYQWAVFRAGDIIDVGVIILSSPPVPASPSVIPRSDYNIKILNIKQQANLPGNVTLAILVLLFPSFLVLKVISYVRDYDVKIEFSQIRVRLTETNVVVIMRDLYH